MYNMMVFLILFFVGWRWGDWRNWTKYHSTILYVIIFDLLYNFLCYKHTLWKYEPNIIFPNHTITSLFVICVTHPSVMLVYLGRYPSGGIKQILWISIYVLSMTLVEWVAVKLGEFSYHNGWSIMWTALFNIGFYSMARLHYKKPLLAYGLSVIATIGMLIIFDVSITEMK